MAENIGYTGIGVLRFSLLPLDAKYARKIAYSTN